MAAGARILSGRPGGLAGSLVVLSGDTPLMSADTISGLIAMRESSGSAVTVLTTRMADPTGYGRIVRDRDGRVLSDPKRLRQGDALAITLAGGALTAEVTEILP